MKTITKLATAAVLTITAATGAIAAPLNTWYGAFGYTEALGPTGAGQDGPSAFVEYRIAVGPGNGATSCRMTIQGYQSDDRITCTATPEMESMIIKYYSGAGARYYLGQPLVRLTRTEGGIMTRWQGVSLSDGTRPAGRFFRRIG